MDFLCILLPVRHIQKQTKSLIVSLEIVNVLFNHIRYIEFLLISTFSFSDKVLSFLGNQTHKDHFKLLRSDGVSLLIGARNVVYNLSLSDLSENIDQVSTLLIFETIPHV